MATRKSCLLLGSLLQLVQLSFSRFVFEFQLHAVTTNGDCSRLFESTPECETYLNRFCLRGAGSSRSNTDDSDCPLGSNNTRFGPDGTLPTSRVILSDSELPWPGEFQMFIRAYDEDIGFDDHLDNIFIEMQLAESNNFTANGEFTGDLNKVNVSMMFQVRICLENFYGVNCDIMCIAQDDGVNGHYTCNGDGSIQCRPGFKNISNDCRHVDPCASTHCANNGNCTAMGPLNYTCECALGYTGLNCEDEIDGCLTMTCPSNGICVNGSNCVCLSGFQLNGELCVEIPTTIDIRGYATTASEQPVDIRIVMGVATSSALGILIIVIVVLSMIVIKGRKPHHRCTRKAFDRQIETKPNEVYGFVSDKDIETKPNEVYGLVSEGDIETKPNEVYGLVTDGDIETKPNEVYGLVSDEDIETKPNEVYGLVSDGDIETKPNEVYGLVTEGDIKTKPNEVYGLVTEGDIETKPNEVYGLVTEGDIETKQNEVYGLVSGQSKVQ